MGRDLAQHFPSQWRGCNRDPGAGAQTRKRSHTRRECKRKHTIKQVHMHAEPLWPGVPSAGTMLPACTAEEAKEHRKCKVKVFKPVKLCISCMCPAIDTQQVAGLPVKAMCDGYVDNSHVPGPFHWDSIIGLDREMNQSMFSGSSSKHT